MAARADRQVGGLRGFFTNAYNSLQTLGTKAATAGASTSKWAFQTAGNWGFYIATTAMVTFMPLLFEIGRERQQLETERSVAKDLRSQGYGDRQLQELGFSSAAIHQPSVASLKK